MAARKKRHVPTPPDQVDEARAYARNPGIDKQRDTVAYWRGEAMRTKPSADAMITLGGTACLDHLATLGDALYVAYHGVSRQASGYQMGTGHPGALALVRAEQCHMKHRRRVLQSKLDMLVGEHRRSRGLLAAPKPTQAAKDRIWSAHAQLFLSGAVWSGEERSKPHAP